MPVGQKKCLPCNSAPVSRVLRELPISWILWQFHNVNTQVGLDEGQVRKSPTQLLRLFWKAVARGSQAATYGRNNYLLQGTSKAWVWRSLTKKFLKSYSWLKAGITNLGHLKSCGFQLPAIKSTSLRVAKAGHSWFKRCNPLAVLISSKWVTLTSLGCEFPRFAGKSSPQPPSSWVLFFTYKELCDLLFQVPFFELMADLHPLQGSWAPSPCLGLHSSTSRVAATTPSFRPVSWPWTRMVCIFSTRKLTWVLPVCSFDPRGFLLLNHLLAFC